MAVSAGGKVGGEARGGADVSASGSLSSPVVVILVVTVIIYFFIMESGNIAERLGEAVGKYRAAGVNPTDTTVELRPGDVLSAAGQAANAQQAAATSNLPNSTTVTPSVQ
jgi:hypothetical protein